MIKPYKKEIKETYIISSDKHMEYIMARFDYYKSKGHEVFVELINNFSRLDCSTVIKVELTITKQR